MNTPKQKETPEMPLTPLYIPKGPLMITLQGDNVENIKNIEFKIEFNERDKGIAIINSTSKKIKC